MDLANSNNYHDKYLKYKAKYLELKKTVQDENQNLLNKDNNHETNVNENDNEKNIGGNSNDNKLVGGGYFYEQNDLIKRIKTFGNKKFKKELYHFSSIYLKANLTNPDVIKKYSKIRKTILRNNFPPPHNYHLTLLIFEINLDYPVIGNSIAYLDKVSGRRKIRKNLLFLEQDEIKSNFETIFKNMILTTEDYALLGKLVRVKLDTNKEINVGVKNPESNDCVIYPGSYFVDKLDINNKNLITTFRIKFYERLNEFMKVEFLRIGGKLKDYVGYRVDNESDPDYILIFYDNFSKQIPLMAIKKFYYGKNTWTPHISIFNMEELVENNKKFLEKYVVDFLTYHDKSRSEQILFTELKKNSIVKQLLKKSAFPKITIDDLDFELQV
jgi:hypothetical protein